MPEHRAAVQTEAGNAQHGELHRQHVALLAARIVAGRLVHRGHGALRKSGGVETRGLMRLPGRTNRQIVFFGFIVVCSSVRRFEQQLLTWVLFGAECVLRVMDHDRGELPSGAGPLQQVHDTGALQLLSVDLAAYGDAPGDDGRCA